MTETVEIERDTLRALVQAAQAKSHKSQAVRRALLDAGPKV